MIWMTMNVGVGFVIVTEEMIEKTTEEVEARFIKEEDLAQETDIVAAQETDTVAARDHIQAIDEDAISIFTHHCVDAHINSI